MRLLLSVLIVANLVLAGYGLLRVTSRPSQHRSELVNADQIRIVPPPPPAQSRPAACLTWGSFAPTELDGVRGELEQALSPGRWSEARVQVIAGWWVFIPGTRDEEELGRRVRELRSLGIEDYYVIATGGELRNTISLGIFKTEETALGFLDGLRSRGVRNARLGARDHRITQTVFVVRDPDVGVSSRLAELALRYPGTELKSGACPMGERSDRPQ
ncbi:MAG: SPOR domain-containing protein [Burkholderiales bacterium]|nr:SPOR domain-containing protein [Burkholderiales bacterium]